MGEPTPTNGRHIDDVYHVEHEDGESYIAHHGLRTFVAVDVDNQGTVTPIPYDYNEFENAIRYDDWSPETVPPHELPTDVKTALETRLSRPIQSPTPACLTTPLDG